MGKWLSVSGCILRMVVRHLPSPIEGQTARINKFWDGAVPNSAPMQVVRANDPSLAKQWEELAVSASECRSKDAEVLVYVAKMIDVGADSVSGGVSLEGEDGVSAAQKREFEEIRKRFRNQKLAASDTTSQVSDNSEQSEQSENPEYVRSAEEKAADAAEEAEEEPKSEEKDDDSDHRDRFVAFCRIFSGTLDTTDENAFVYVYNPKYSPTSDSARNEEYVHRVPVSSLRLFVLMGRDTHQVPKVSAGNVFAIKGLGRFLLNTGTVSSLPRVVPFSPMQYQSKPIVRVAVEPDMPADEPLLIRGLQLLNQADPNVEVRVQDTGEHVIVASGELHLERCLLDLREQFAPGVRMHVSNPIVEFRESIIHDPADDAKEADGVLVDADSLKGDLPGSLQLTGLRGSIQEEDEKDGEDGNNVANDEQGDFHQEKQTKSVTKVPFTYSRETLTSNKCCRLVMRAIPLPTAVTLFLQKNEKVLKPLFSRKSRKSAPGGPDVDTESDLSEASIIIELRALLRTEFQKTENFSEDDVERVWALGPRKYGPNVLLNRTTFSTTSVFPPSSPSSAPQLGRIIDNGIVNGFQMSTLAGPLCTEQMMGVAFAVETIEFNAWDESRGPDPYGPISGQIISATRSLCADAFMAHSPRLMEAMYSMELQCTPSTLGRLYTVLPKRRAKIISEDMREGTNSFVIKAHLPVYESFGFSKEIRKRTSGVASPQLIFSHWEIMTQDPFWQPTTEEELEEFGDMDKALYPNLVRDIINNVRQRKGLRVETKIVEHAEKQRTLSRKK